jgi:hypothetical protein
MLFQPEMEFDNPRVVRYASGAPDLFSKDIQVPYSKSSQEGIYEQFGDIRLPGSPGTKSMPLTDNCMKELFI